MKKGALIMAYGTPDGLDDVERYYTDIRRGNPPPPELLEELTDRYRAIGRSPLYEITRAQADGIGERLGDVEVFLGQKHTAPFVPDAIRAMHEAGVTVAAGLVLAPHFSTMSVGDYRRRALTAASEYGWEGRLEMVESWHLEPGYISFLSDAVTQALGETGSDGTTVIFSAHSLPEKILSEGDPYPSQLQETADAVTARAGLSRSAIAWQSAGRTKDPWIGPDLLDVIRAEHDSGAKGIVVCACGFVSDHLEVLYDVDIEAKTLADELGLRFARTRMPNTEPAFLDMLAGVVERTLAR